MSLFNVCNWWSTQCSDLLENYDVASLLCARFGLESQEKDYIIVGSHSGCLSIFYPNPDFDTHFDDNVFKPTDLLLETNLKIPILGVYAGRFSGNLRNENSNQLAILHPNSVAIYNVQSISGLAEHGTQLRLHLQVEHKFRRVAFSLCKGHFGQIKGREFFCVVHLDGTLTFFEQDGITYECTFPGHRALPVPVEYCMRTDSFFRLSSSWNLECFSYQDLSQSTINKTTYKPTWSVCIGEGIMDMCVVQVKEESSWILILGERNLICLNDNGKFNFILKLDYVPKCFHTFMVGYYWEPTSRLITAIVSNSSKLFIYDEANIIWAAQCQFEAPVAIVRSNLNSVPGSIVTLGPNGQLNIGFLGSDPFIFKVPPLNNQELTFVEAQKELQQLEDNIKEAVDIRDMESLNKSAEENVRLQFNISPDINENFDTLMLDVPADVAMKELPAASGSLRLKIKVDLLSLQVVVNTPTGVRCSTDSQSFVDVTAGTVKEYNLDFYIADLLHIHTTSVDVIVSYISTKGIPRVIQQSAYLPLSMFYKKHQPQKVAGTKLTYAITSKTLQPKLSRFFPEFITSDVDVQVLGLVLMCPGREKMDEIITIVAAKNSNRIRIQSDNLEAFPMILERLISTTLNHDLSKSLIKTDKKKAKKGVLNRKVESIIATPFIPVQQILHRIEVHNETQKNIREETKELDDLWSQLKTLQRKLQEKADDEPKETLVMQIEENYDHLILEGDKLVEMRKEERKQRCDLNCAISVARWIITTLNIEERVVNVISSVLFLPIEDWTELSWEQTMSPGIDMLHHYGPLSRSSSSSNTISSSDSKYTLADSSNYQDSFDCKRFKSNFATLFDRIVRLASIDLNEIQQNNHDDVAVDNDNQTIEARRRPTNEINELNRVLEMDSNRRRSIKNNTLESVDDNEDEYDEDDLRQVGYRKDYGTVQKQKSTDCSDWVNEDFELPTTEQLFSDLGIWW